MGAYLGVGLPATSTMLCGMLHFVLVGHRRMCQLAPTAERGASIQPTGTWAPLRLLARGGTVNVLVFLESGVGVQRHQPLRNLLWVRAPRPGSAALVISVFWLAMAVVFGWLEHLVDGKTFPSTGLGVWWAIQTVTTVGYGDVVPEQTSGRIVTGVLMLGGLSLLSVLTAAVTSVFVTRAQAELREKGGDPLMQQLDELTSEGGEIASLKAEISQLRADLSKRQP